MGITKANIDKGETKESILREESEDRLDGSRFPGNLAQKKEWRKC